MHTFNISFNAADIQGRDNTNISNNLENLSISYKSRDKEDFPF